MAVGLRPRGGRAGGEADGGQIQTWALLLMGERPGYLGLAALVEPLLMT